MGSPGLPLTDTLDKYFLKEERRIQREFLQRKKKKNPILSRLKEEQESPKHSQCKGIRGNWEQKNLILKCSEQCDGSAGESFAVGLSSCVKHFKICHFHILAAKSPLICFWQLRQGFNLHFFGTFCLRIQLKLL